MGYAMSDKSEESQYYESVDYETVIIQATKDFVEKPKTSPAKSEDKDRLESVTLNIAITGESGVGKSSFVNALLGLREGEEGAAETGVTETTMTPTKYSHPTVPNVFIWDLPGIGTSNFKAKTYLKNVQFDTYDFFIIINSVRFKENDILLAKEIKKMKKTFFFIRTKIDNDVRTESRKKDFDEDKMLFNIRMSCKDKLKEFGNVKVFLISTAELWKYDFQKLVNALEQSLPEQKQYVLIQSMPICSTDIIDKKKKSLVKLALAASAGTGLTAVIPIPGTSVGVSIGAMLLVLKKAHSSFGLDERSIKRLADRFNKPTSALTSVMKSRFIGGVNEQVVKDMLKTEAMIVAKTIESLLSVVVICGNLAAMGLSFATTLHLLIGAVNDMAKDAKAVLSVVMQDFS